MDIFDEKYISPLVCDLEDCEEICPHFYWDEKHIGSCKLDDNWQRMSHMKGANKQVEIYI